jgi:hypothetical protein
MTSILPIGKALSSPFGEMTLITARLTLSERNLLIFGER